MSRILGIDYGRKRIGIAIADLETRIAIPITRLDGRDEPTRDARLTTDLGLENDVEAFVVGLPMNMDGSEGEQAAVTRKFGAELERLSGKPVHYQDERLSSDVARSVIASAGIPAGKEKELVDQIAAQKILQAYLDRDAGDKENIASTE